MDCDALRNDQWDRIKGFVPGDTKGKRGPRIDNRKFVDALLWMACPGRCWRDPPHRDGCLEARRLSELESEDTRLKRILSNTKLDNATLGAAS